MHLDSRSLHAPSALGVERRKEKNSCPAGLKPCTVVLADLELKCMDTFFPSAWYHQLTFTDKLLLLLTTIGIAIFGSIAIAIGKGTFLLIDKLLLLLTGFLDYCY